MSPVLRIITGGLVLFYPAAAFAQTTELNTGDIAWVATAAVLVMIMTPALGFFYAGLVRTKNIISTLTQCVGIFAVVSLVWTLWGYSIAFGPSVNGLFGDLSWFGLSGVGAAPNAAYAATIPALLFYFFQLKFAAITPALIIGAFAERVRFMSLLIFVVLWTTFVYSPIAHWVWNPDGWLRKLGALDFAGGTVVHIAAGFSALACAWLIGRRKDASNGAELKPSNIPFVILGAALLWFGWFGFNAGSTLAAGELAVSALVVTNVAAAAGAVSWMLMDWSRKRKASAVGIAIGAVCGLVAITPASGFVNVSSSLLIGFVAGIVSNIAANWRVRTRLDDSLDVFACHGVSGIWGSLATGLFATLTVNAAGANGFFYGNSSLLWNQVLAVAAVAAFSFFGSALIWKITNSVFPLRVEESEEEQGLDTTQHGET
ncbi:ammonium transporter [Candidatus Uhrbacteria bacterium]|nr:ammonium transporter [Candidatus Uhrbacteria bacterium]